MFMHVDMHQHTQLMSPLTLACSLFVILYHTRAHTHRYRYRARLIAELLLQSDTPRDFIGRLFFQRGHLCLRFPFIHSVLVAPTLSLPAPLAQSLPLPSLSV